MKKKIIKIIAVILMAAFIAQDIILAFPNIRQNTPSQSSLQIPSMFQDIRFDRYAGMLEARLKYVLSAISYLKDFNYRLTLPIDAEGIKVDLNFDRQYPEGENTVLPCALYKSGSSILYEAVITPDGSIQLREKDGKKDAAIAESYDKFRDWLKSIPHDKLERTISFMSLLETPLNEILSDTDAHRCQNNSQALKALADKGIVAREEVKIFSAEEINWMFREVYGRDISIPGYIHYYLKFIAILKDDPLLAYQIFNWRLEELSELFQILDHFTKSVALVVGRNAEEYRDYFLEKELVKSHLAFLGDPKAFIGHLRQRIKTTIGDSSVRLAIKVYEITSVGAAKGLIKALGVSKDNVIILYDEEIGLEQANRFFPGYEIRAYPDFSGEASIRIEFHDFGNMDIGYSDNAFFSFLPYIPFKFNLPERAQEEELDRMRESLGIGQRKVIVLGSPSDTEFNEFIKSYNSLYGDIPYEKRPLLIIGFRQRGNENELRLLGSLSGQSIAVRSDDKAPLPKVENNNVLILNTIGELLKMYGLADIAIVGNDRNMLEPASQNAAVLYFEGSWINNLEVKKAMSAAGAAQVFSKENMERLINAHNEAEEMVRNGQGVVDGFRKKIKSMAEEFALRVIAADSKLRNKFIAVPSTVKAEDTLCLTPDSFITLADGSQKPLIELKPLSDRVGRTGMVEDGDMVLSLNEQTGRLEPHRVLALLNMGVKPVYRITTQNGKSLKTTLTHPYLTKNGWRKLSEIKVEEEITVMKEAINHRAGIETYSKIKGRGLSLHAYGGSCFLADTYFGFGNYSKPITKDFRLIALKERENYRGSLFYGGRFDFYKDYPGIRANRKTEDISEVIIKGKQNSFFLNTEIDNFFIRETAEIPFKNSINFVSVFPESFYRSNEEAFISKKSHLGSFLDKYIFILNDSYSIMDSGLDIFAGKLGIAITEDAFGSITCFNKFQDKIDGDTCPFDTGLTKTNLGVDRDSFFKSIFLHLGYLRDKIYHSFIRLSSQNAYTQVSSTSDILWDKIISIEPLGPMQVYDIEVEATHNFIAEGIVAHNTYQNNPLQGGAITVTGRPLTPEEHQDINDAIRDDFVYRRARALTDKELDELDPDGILKNSGVTVYVVHSLKYFDQSLVAHPGRGGDRVNHNKKHIYLSPERLKFIRGLLQEAKREFWVHEVGHITMASETQGQATEAQVQERYPISKVLAEAQGIPVLTQVSLNPFFVPGTQEANQEANKRSLESIEKLIQESTSAGKVTRVDSKIIQSVIEMEENKVFKGKLEVMTVDTGEMFGFPYGSSRAAKDLIYAYAKYDRPSETLTLYVTERFYDTYICASSRLGATMAEYLYDRIMRNVPETDAAKRLWECKDSDSKVSFFHKIVLDLIAKENDRATLEAFDKDTTQHQDVTSYVRHLLHLLSVKPVMQATVGVMVGHDAFGTGFGVGEDKGAWYVLTNYHVVDPKGFGHSFALRRDDIDIFIPAEAGSDFGKALSVSVIATSPEDDLALLMLKKSDETSSLSLGVATLSLRQPEDMPPPEQVIVVTLVNPYGGQRDWTDGNTRYARRDFRERKLITHDFNQTNLILNQALWPGASGSAVLFVYGDESRVIGVHSFGEKPYSQWMMSPNRGGIVRLSRIQKFLEEHKVPGVQAKITQAEEAIEQANKKITEKAERADRKFDAFMNSLLKQVERYDPLLSEINKQDGILRQTLKEIEKQNKALVVVVGREALESVDFMATVQMLKTHKAPVLFAGVLTGPISPQLRSFTERLLDAWVEVEVSADGSIVPFSRLKAADEELWNKLNELRARRVAAGQPPIEPFSRENTLLLASNKEGESYLYGETFEECLLKRVMGPRLPLAIVRQPQERKEDKMVAHHSSAVAALILSLRIDLSEGTIPSSLQRARQEAQELQEKKLAILSKLPSQELAKIERNVRSALKTKEFSEIISGSDLFIGNDKTKPGHSGPAMRWSGLGPTEAQHAEYSALDSEGILRDIVDTEQLSRNMVECILSYIFSNKRLVLAFDDNLTGFKRQKVKQIIQAVEAWKDAAANKSDAMRRLLTNNLTVLQYSSLDELREKLRPDLDDNERNIIFAFTARIEDEAHSPANMGRAVRAVLMEGGEKFTEEDYYPLVEVVTLALAKELSGWDRYTLLSTLAKLNIDYRKLGISDIDEDSHGIIIFRLLPVMKRYDSNERVDRYARLLQSLRSA